MKIAILGCAGRMGRMIIQTILERKDAVLSGGIERPGSPALGVDLGVLAGREQTGLVVSDDVRGVLCAADVAIDFTLADSTMANVRLAAETGTALVIGATGFDAAADDAIDDAARRVPIVQSGNMSVGVNVLLSLVQQASALLGEEYDIEVLEMHHRNKVDAPSGTALMLGRAAARGRAAKFDDLACYSREGHTGARPKGEIGFATLRGGDVVGTHRVIFAGESECLELSHKASSRALFAKGAVRAALWLPVQPPGRYCMHQVLGLS